LEVHGEAPVKKIIRCVNIFTEYYHIGGFSLHPNVSPIPLIVRATNSVLFYFSSAAPPTFLPSSVLFTLSVSFWSLCFPLLTISLIHSLMVPLSCLIQPPTVVPVVPVVPRSSFIRASRCVALFH